MNLKFHRGGVFLPALNLWLDAHHRVTDDALVFVSHAHADHTRRHREVILTPATGELMRARIGGKRIEHRLAFHERKEFRGAVQDFAVTLLPAGHVLGSAMALVEWGGQSLLYTGDFKLERGLSSETCDPDGARGVDALIMETTFGRPEYRFPEGAAVIGSMKRFCRETLGNNETPLLLGYSLGKSQEILRGLLGEGLPVMLHKAVHEMTRIYQSFGMEFPAYEVFDPAKARGKVLIGPPSSMMRALPQEVGRVRTAMMTGWAIDPGCRYRYGADAAFPLSDHADFPGLIEMVRRVAPGKVFTLHGFSADFAQTLRELGFDAEALSEVDQLHLGLGLGTGTSESAGSAEGAGAVSSKWWRARSESVTEQVTVDRGSYGDFAEVVERVEEVMIRADKVRLLAAYFRTADPRVLRSVVGWLSGGVQRRPMGWVVFREALAVGLGQAVGELERAYVRHASVGGAVAEFLSHDVRNPVLGVSEVDAFLKSAGSNGRNGVGRLAVLLRTATPAEGRVLGRLAEGDLRIGLSIESVLEAIAVAWGGRVEAVSLAFELLGNIGDVAIRAREGTLDAVGAEPFRPTRLGLELEGPGVWCELHRAGGRVALYASDRVEVSGRVPGIVEDVNRVGIELMLSGRVAADRRGESLAGDEILARLRNAQGDLFGEEIEFRFIARDLIWKSGESLLHLPARRRLEMLAELGLAEGGRVCVEPGGEGGR